MQKVFGSDIDARRLHFVDELEPDIRQHFRFSSSAELQFALEWHNPDSRLNLLPELGPLQLIQSYIDSTQPWLITNYGEMCPLAGSDDWRMFSAAVDWHQLLSQTCCYYPFQRRSLLEYTQSSRQMRLLEQNGSSRNVSSYFNAALLHGFAIFNPANYDQTLYSHLNEHFNCIEIHTLSEINKQIGADSLILSYCVECAYNVWTVCLSTRHHKLLYATKGEIVMTNSYCPMLAETTRQAVGNVESIVDTPDGNVLYACQSGTRGSALFGNSVRLYSVDLRETDHRFKHVSSYKLSSKIQNRALQLACYNGGNSLILANDEERLTHYDVRNTKWTTMDTKLRPISTVWIIDND